MTPPTPRRTGLTRAQREAPTLVRQEHAYGCQVAICAMLLGISYAEALRLHPSAPDEVRGFGSHVLDNILVEHGYAIARRYRHDASKIRDREPWPPPPWADVHWCQVVTAQGGHAVLMLADGTVLDPACGQPRRFTDYPEVQFVAAVVPMPLAGRLALQEPDHAQS